MYKPSNFNYFKENVREVTGGVYVYEGIGSQVVSETLLPHDTLISIIISKDAPAGKFFGFSVGQELKIEVIGKKHLAQTTKIQPYINQTGFNTTYFPNFYIESITENETSNKTIITAYDLLSIADKITWEEAALEISYPITAVNLANRVVSYLGGVLVDADALSTIELTQDTVNLSGAESLRVVLEALAEFSGCICYCTAGNQIKFRVLSNTVDDTISADNYFTLSIEDEVTLTQVASSTELNDNLVSGVEGYTQVLWDNPFLSLRDDAATLLDEIADKVLNLVSSPVNFSWRGSPFYEIGDYIQINTAKGETKYVRYLGETLTYYGGLRSNIIWQNGQSENIHGQANTIGNLISQTSAKIDKANQRIQLAVTTVEGMDARVTEMELNTEGVKASVSNMSTTFSEMDERIANLTQKVEATMTAEEINIAIQESVENVDSATKVTTTTGFKFDEEGLTVSKSDSEIATQITEDGMKITKTGTEVLDVNNRGVSARNLQATTFLIIGQNSRFEDYENNTRTGCFWIG